MTRYEQNVSGWLKRWLWCWLGVLVAGCGTATTPPSATLIPLAVLPGYTRVPPTWTPILRLLRTATPLPGTLMVSSTATLSIRLTPPPLRLDPPTCYETPVGSLWCLGLIHNTWALMVTGVQVRVWLVTTDGTALAQQDALSARQIIRPNEAAPYAVLFTAPPAEMAGPVAEMVQAASMPTAPVLVHSLPTHDIHSTWVANHYRVQAQIDNPGTEAVRVSAVVTLLDEAGRVTGFRQIDAGLLAGAGTLSLDVDVIPVAAGTVQTLIAADGLNVAP